MKGISIGHNLHTVDLLFEGSSVQLRATQVEAITLYTSTRVVYNFRVVSLYTL